MLYVYFHIVKVSSGRKCRMNLRSRSEFVFWPWPQRLHILIPNHLRVKTIPVWPPELIQRNPKDKQRENVWRFTPAMSNFHLRTLSLSIRYANTRCTLNIFICRVKRSTYCLNLKKIYRLFKFYCVSRIWWGVFCWMRSRSPLHRSYRGSVMSRTHWRIHPYRSLLQCYTHFLRWPDCNGLEKVVSWLYEELESFCSEILVKTKSTQRKCFNVVFLFPGWAHKYKEIFGQTDQGPYIRHRWTTPTIKQHLTYIIPHHTLQLTIYRVK